jgi:uncharacterized RDD family membrane protein YckC
MTTPQPHPLNPNAHVGGSTSSFRYASFQHRLGAYALDAALCVLTLGIGWFIWALVVWGNGQTPGKQILKIRTFNAVTGRPATWGHMALREFLVPFTVGIASFVTGGIAAIAWIVIEIVFYFNKASRTLRDLWVKTAVVNEA